MSERILIRVMVVDRKDGFITVKPCQEDATDNIVNFLVVKDSAEVLTERGV